MIIIKIKEQEDAFKEIWEATFEVEDTGEELHERDDNFSNLYSIFKMEFSRI